VREVLAAQQLPAHITSFVGRVAEMSKPESTDELRC